MVQFTSPYQVEWYHHSKEKTIISHDRYSPEDHQRTKEERVTHVIVQFSLSSRLKKQWRLQPLIMIIQLEERERGLVEVQYTANLFEAQ